ncbi:DUF1501 domain-containing protein [Planctomyces sp. SH-PL14]|uniref:DUF1501 domain-containing protein n=1 Tax=Planctomyces sp. SH-PL14 TaxID=1632864 RepID=UPI00078EDFF7|nr:DUF1501 domain-containing protein [Planctomyces sp. SH-PL14]AMV19764.1 hypothetical protein VT03_17840 [Planctomyces sp. SH-PL14]
MNDAAHASSPVWSFLNARRPEGLQVHSRRNVLKVGLAGIGGLTLPRLLQQQAQGAAAGARPKSVILLWMAGGPSHIDMWDPKPDRPYNNRGPFSVISSKLPGVIVCEHLPKIAGMMDKLTVIRSVDCKGSNHEPNKVMQTGNREAEPRSNPNGDKYASFGSIIAKHRRDQTDAMPAYVAFQKSRTHVAYGGWLGKEYDPFLANTATRLPILTDVGVDTGQMTGADIFRMSSGVSVERLESRRELATQFDRMRTNLDQSGIMEAGDVYQQQAVEMLLGQKAQRAFDLSREEAAVRDRYGKHLWCQQALVARRLVQAGSSFVTLDLSYHGASGTWDTHGDNIPPYGGISKGLGPLLPLFDHLLTTLVSDLERCGLLDSTLVIAMGEFGRTPNMGTQGSTDGRDHWPEVMSMCLAGGGLRHGQVIGSSDPQGGTIASRPVTPGDLAATIYQYMGVPLDATYDDDRGRPRYIVEENGRPVSELF